jgi:hypothetical protein
MSKKRLHTAGIVNELEGASLFFQPREAEKAKQDGQLAPLLTEQSISPTVQETPAPNTSISPEHNQPLADQSVNSDSRTPVRSRVRPYGGPLPAMRLNFFKIRSRV